MALQGFNFSSLGRSTPKHGGLANLLNDYRNGFFGGQERAAQLQGNQLGNQLQGQKVENYEEDRSLSNALKQAQIQKLLTGGESANLHGIPREFADLNRLIQDPNIPENIKQSAIKAFKQREGLQESLASNRNAQTETAHKRSSSGLGKAILERKEAEEGFLPGSDRQVRLTPAKQKALIGQYDNQILKHASDPKTKERVEAAINIDKTLDSFNPEALVKYSGLKGKLKGIGENVSSLTGKASSGYKEYENAVSLSKLLAKQVRQFYGDSVTKNATQALESLTNPTNWRTSPEIALEKFNAFANTLRKETETYRKSLQDPYELLGNSADQNMESDPGRQQMIMQILQELKGLPSDE